MKRLPGLQFDDRLGWFFVSGRGLFQQLDGWDVHIGVKQKFYFCETGQRFLMQPHELGTKTIGE